MKSATLAILSAPAVLALGACAEGERDIPEQPEGEEVLDVISDAPESVQNYEPTVETADGDETEESGEADESMTEATE
jgi:hypothetical protein